MKKSDFGISRKRLDEIIDEATVDCYNEREARADLLTMVEDNVVCPFRAKVSGEEIEVIALEWPESGYEMMAVCERKGRSIASPSPRWKG